MSTENLPIGEWEDIITGQIIEILSFNDSLSTAQVHYHSADRCGEDVISTYSLLELYRPVNK